MKPVASHLFSLKAHLLFVIFAATVSASALTAFTSPDSKTASPVSFAPAVLRMPWKAAGLTERQAAAHLLDRFAFGQRPGDIDRVVKMGLENWLTAQLQGNLPEQSLTEKLKDFGSLALTSKELNERYPAPAQIVALARREGKFLKLAAVANVSDDSLARIAEQNMAEMMNKKDPAKKDPKSPEKNAYREALQAYAEEKGLRPQREAVTELVEQKIFRGVYSENQLQAVLADFWFNHFNISLTNAQARRYIITYERDAIRRNALSPFPALLQATAKHPSMLFYLDNARSVAPEGTPTTFSFADLRPNAKRNMEQMEKRDPQQAKRMKEKADAMTDQKMDERIEGQLGKMGLTDAEIQKAKTKLKEAKKNAGINENYARELMELHTLGVDGGYAQQDIINVARALTGWTALDPRADSLFEARLEQAKARNIDVSKFVRDGDFLFRADRHDAAEKTILGKKFPAGRGIEDGEDVLKLLASHPSTAKFISKKLATRFVSDTPTDAMVKSLAEVFTRTQGDTRELITAIANSPEFWKQPTRGAKIKSPFELAVSSLRATNADVADAKPLAQWISRMGQPLFAYQAPTGYPDRASVWINTGSLLARMNFGLNLAFGRIKGTSLDLYAINGNHEPESPEDALETYGAILLPERNLSKAIEQMKAVAREPELSKKVAGAAPSKNISRDSAEALREAG
ncbi:MAG: DUF1800 domain-containing protein, partial [Rhizobacter sp.]|nr:DUF1800 domain-containing protein [Chlorobiales bacterium]